jgi:hypothetical protein
LFELPFDIYLEFLENQILQVSHKQGMGYQEIEIGGMKIIRNYTYKADKKKMPFEF